MDNDATLVNIAKQVISHAKAGVDMVAPSGMMDGTIETIRQALDSYRVSKFTNYVLFCKIFISFLWSV